MTQGVRFIIGVWRYEAVFSEQRTGRSEGSAEKELKPVAIIIDHRALTWVRR